MVDSNSDDRHKLSDEEKMQMDTVKELGADFITILHKIGGSDPANGQMKSRDLSLAQTHIEDAVMRATRHITG